MMTSVTELLKIQQTVGENIQCIIRNFKKDSADKIVKSSYFEERHKILSAEWDKFNDAYGKLRLLAKQPSDMENFTSQYFERVRKLAEEHIEIFKNELNRLGITEHETPHAIQSSLEFPRTSSHTNPVDSNENIFRASPQAAIGKLSARMPALGRFISRVDHITSNENQEFYKVRINVINKLWNQVE